MSSLRDDIETIYRTALRAVDPAHAVRQAFTTSNGSISVGSVRVPVGAEGIYGIAIGKAAALMMEGLVGAVGDAFVSGIAVTKTSPATSPPRTRVLLGAHPVPDQRSLDAGQAVLDFARSVPDGATVVCLISGGGSALAEVLRPGVTLDELRRVTGELLRAGASITEMNAVRSRLSAFKGGGLLAALGQATVFNLIVSDVLGDDPRSIASGPTVLPDRSAQAEDVLRRYAVAVTLPDPDDRPLSPPRLTEIVASIATAVNAAGDAARQRGYTPTVLSRSIDGEAREVGRIIACIVADTCGGTTSFAAPCCLIGGGETVVTMRGNGVGGRNTEAALAAAIRLQGTSGCAVGFLATDGDDGTSGAAGGIVDGTTVDAGSRQAATEALDANDSFTFLEDRGAALITGSSGTNVNDLMIALIR
jgi:hydroxypyruvate reductase